MSPDITIRVATCCRSAVRRDRGLQGGEEYVERTLGSICNSDIPEEQVEIFESCHPNATPEYREMTERHFVHILEEWQGHYEAYANALHCPFEGDWLLLLEDDVEVDPLIYSRTQRFIEANPELRLATLFDQLTKQRDQLWIDPGSWWGSQAVLFHRSVIPRIPKTFEAFLKRWPEMRVVLDFPVWDAVISMCCKEPRMYVHRPSLVEHIGVVRSWTDAAQIATSNQCLTSQAA